MGLIAAQVDQPAYMLAALAGMHPSTWSRYVHGQPIRLEDANRIAAVFGIDREELYGAPDAEFLARLPEIRVSLSSDPVTA